LGVVSHPAEMCYYSTMGHGFFLTNPMILVFAIQGQKNDKGYCTLKVNEIWLQDCQRQPNYPLLVRDDYLLMLNLYTYIPSTTVK